MNLMWECDNVNYVRCTHAPPHVWGPKDGTYPDLQTHKLSQYSSLSVSSLSLQIAFGVSHAATSQLPPSGATGKRQTIARSLVRYCIQTLTLVNSLHGLLNCEMDGLDWHVITT